MFCKHGARMFAWPAAANNNNSPQLKGGIHKISLAEGCVLSGVRWALHGVVRRYFTATAHIQGISIPPLDIAALLHQEAVGNNSYQVHLDLKNSNDHYLPKYMNMNNDNDGYPELILAHHLSWMSITLIILLCILCTCVGIWVFRWRFQIKLFFKDALKGARLAKERAQRVDNKVKYSAKAPEGVQLGILTDEVSDVTETV